MSYEYKEITQERRLSIDALNELGKERWELVIHELFLINSDVCHQYILKRKVYPI